MPGLQRGSVIQSREAAFAAARQAHLSVAVRALRRHRGQCALSHETAAIALGLPTYRLPVKATLTRTTGSRRSTGRTDVAVAALPLEQVLLVNGVPVTSMARTVIDIARRRPFLEALVTADAALRRGLPQRQLVDVLAQMPRWPGAAAAAEVVRWADGHAESPAESVVRARFILLGLPIPRLQVWVDDHRRVDFLWDEVSLIGEVDGRVKYEGPDGADELWAEKLRRDDLEDERSVIRFNWRQAHAQDDEFRARFWRAWERARRYKQAG